MILTDVLQVHAHQVLHVSFSHNGKMFSTCSKDGFVIVSILYSIALIWSDCNYLSLPIYLFKQVWNSTYPSTKKYSYDMKTLCWKYTQYSQFNSTDTLLLVSGVHFGVHNSTSGEIAVFGLEAELKLRCRIVNRPYDIFGTWFTDRYLLSGDLNWLQHLISSSVIWLNKASQEITSEHVPIMNKLFKFYNKNASSVRSIMVADCPWLANGHNIPEDEQSDASGSTSSVHGNRLIDSGFNSEEYCAGNPISQAVFDKPGPSRQYFEPYGAEQYWDDEPYASTFQYSDEFRDKYLGDYSSDHYDEDDDTELSSEEEINHVLEEEMTKLDLPENKVIKAKPTAEEVEDIDDDDLETAPPKYLIFTTGSKAYVPHQIAFKRIDKVVFPKQLDPGPSLKERIALQRLRRESESLYEEPDWSDFNAVSDRFDKIDKIIDLHGQIIGMALSPDHRFLYVNCRVWPQNYVIRNPLEPPPIAQEIDIHVIDLMTFKKVGKMLRAHRAYTPNTDCFFIFLDVCDKYVASGAEDMHAYIWDRYYGMCMAKYEHSDVVNSVAFNPCDNEMLVTTSDDYEIKVRGHL